MRWTDLYVAGTGSWIPPLLSTEAAVADGRYDAAERAENDYVSVAVSEDESAPEMAVRAAKAALDRAGVANEDFGLLLHAGCYHQGQDMWTPASYVQRYTVGGSAPAIEVSQGSNGGLAALELAAGYLTANPTRPAALITTSDRYCPPGFDRFRSAQGVVFADGATALVLSAREGVARLVSTSHISVPDLEEIYRGTDGFTTHSLAGGMPLDLRQRSDAYLAGVDMMVVMSTMVSSTRNVVAAALEDADVALEEIDAFVLPNLGRPFLKWEFLDSLGIDEARTTNAWGREVAHLSAGDQFGGLDHLLTTERVRSGDRVLLIGSGVGFTWSAAVLEVL